MSSSPSSRPMSERSTLRIWLAGPLQSWGTSSRFEVRATELAPSKSGVLGLVCAALGRPRDAPVDDLAALRFGVGVEDPGAVLRDFHTVGAGTDPVAVASGGPGRGIVTNRYYLQDAAFVAGLEGPRRALLEELRDALAGPVWLLCLGRKSCPPAGPLVDDHSIVDGPLEEALSVRWCPDGATHPGRGLVDLLIEDDDGTMVLDDQPSGAAFASRTFRPRRLMHRTVDRGVR